MQIHLQLRLRSFGRAHSRPCEVHLLPGPTPGVATPSARPGAPMAVSKLLVVSLPLTASFVLPQPPAARHPCTWGRATDGASHYCCRAAQPSAVATLMDEPGAAEVAPAKATPPRRAKLAFRLWGFSSSGEQLGPHIVFMGKVLNWFGALYICQALFWAIFWTAGMTISSAVSAISPWDPRRKYFDKMGKWWAWWNMKVGLCAPATITGLEHIPSEGQPCVFAANHASWFDIPLVAQCIPSTFKFVASESLKKLPLIGQQLVGGRHVLINRRSRKSQLRSFKESVGWLNQGVSIMAFPEGTRSRDGKLAKKFKGGVFAMATKSKVPIVPISLVRAPSRAHTQTSSTPPIAPAALLLAPRDKPPLTRACRSLSGRHLLDLPARGADAVRAEGQRSRRPLP